LDPHLLNVGYLAPFQHAAGIALMCRNTTAQVTSRSCVSH